VAASENKALTAVMAGDSGVFVPLPCCRHHLYVLTLLETSSLNCYIVGGIIFAWPSRWRYCLCSHRLFTRGVLRKTLDPSLPNQKMAALSMSRPIGGIVFGATARWGRQEVEQCSICRVDHGGMTQRGLGGGHDMMESHTARTQSDTATP
jgi:hypothetical protein